MYFDEQKVRKIINGWKASFRFVDRKLVILYGPGTGIAETAAAVREIAGHHMSGKFEVAKVRNLSIADTKLIEPDTSNDGIIAYDHAFDEFDNLLTEIVGVGMLVIIPAGHPMWEDDESAEAMVFTPDP